MKVFVLSTDTDEDLDEVVAVCSTEGKVNKIKSMFRETQFSVKELEVDALNTQLEDNSSVYTVKLIYLDEEQAQAQQKFLEVVSVSTLREFYSTNDYSKPFVKYTYETPKRKSRPLTRDGLPKAPAPLATSVSVTLLSGTFDQAAVTALSIITELIGKFGWGNYPNTINEKDEAEFDEVAAKAIRHIGGGNTDEEMEESDWEDEEDK